VCDARVTEVAAAAASALVGHYEMSAAMATQLAALDLSDSACDVFLSATTRAPFLDCLRRVLLCVGGMQARRQQLVKVFLDQASFKSGSTTSPWPVVQHEAENCRVGTERHPPAAAAKELLQLSIIAAACTRAMCVCFKPPQQLSQPLCARRCFVTTCLVCALLAAVVVLSPELVRKAPARELHMFLERKARDPASVAIVPVLLGLTVEECGDLEALYSQPWPVGVPEPSKQERAESLAEWAAVVKQLLRSPVTTSKEVGGGLPFATASTDA
jgi:hypothetical protein